MATDEKLQNNAENKEAKKILEHYAKKRKALLRATGVPAFITATATLSDKFSRGEDGSLSNAGFASFFGSNLISGAMHDILMYKFMLASSQTNMEVQNDINQLVDSYPIADRLSRKTDLLINDEDSIKNSAHEYFSSKAKMLQASIALATFTAATVVSGGAAALPMMGSVIGLSGVSAYLMNKRTNKIKIDNKNEIREFSGQLRAHARNMRQTSLERELNDPHKKEYKTLEEKQNNVVKSFRKFTNLMTKYAVIGTAVKAAVMTGAAIASWSAGPVAVLVGTTAALGAYGAASNCVNAMFSKKEHIGNFSKAYNNIKPKIDDISFGKEKIKEKSNVIQLENIAFKHRDKNNVKKRDNNTLFSSDEVFEIGTGVSILSGASGAGKSSLINLLMHSDDVVNGSIKIGSYNKDNQFEGVDYKDLEFGEPAKNIALSMQKGGLSEMNVDSFIRLANPDAEEEFVDKIKNLVGIKKDPTDSSTIDPDLIIPADGQGISGGQINRLNLAQALIKDSNILILDEPTAGVDATMKDNIINYINEIKDDKTIVYITHNVDEIKNLKTYQALDIGKSLEDENNTIIRYDLTNAQEKQEYIEFFSDRNNKERAPSRSSKEHVAEEEKSKKEGKSSERLQQARDKLLAKNEQRSGVVHADRFAEMADNGLMVGPSAKAHKKAIDFMSNKNYLEK